VPTYSDGSTPVRQPLTSRRGAVASDLVTEETNPDAPDAEEAEPNEQVSGSRGGDPSEGWTRTSRFVHLYRDAIWIQEDDPELPKGVVPSKEELDEWLSRLIRINVFIKERPRGPGYVCDFWYENARIPVTMSGIVCASDRGLFIRELEIFPCNDQDWGYVDGRGSWIGPEAWRRIEEEERLAGGEDEVVPETFPGISSSLLRRLPLADVLQRTQRLVTSREWDEERGFQYVSLERVSDEEWVAAFHSAKATLDRVAATVDHVSESGLRGRPPLPDELLERVARAYLDEMTGGRGITKRLASIFDRPDQTVRAWVHMARKRGFLSPAQPGRRGALPGPRLSRDPGLWLQHGDGHESDTQAGAPDE